jgi:hypothetical protein
MHLGDYDGSQGRPRYRVRIKRRPPLSEDMPDEATARVIREKAEKYPNFTPEEIQLFLAYEDGRMDITSKMTRAVLYEGE